MKFYFDIRNGTMAIDDEGIELDGFAAAVREARKTLASVSAETIMSGHSHVSIDVRDGERVVCSASMTIEVRRC
jgi:DNA-binding IclR family transcriptional regulator